MACPSRKILIVVLLAVIAAAAAMALRPRAEKPALGLFTTLPLFWREADDLRGVLSDKQEPHWVRVRLEKDYALRPLDVLTGGAAGGSGPDGMRNLLMAQPRALSPQENVALDRWVREGGRLLLFADPMLTAHSAFALGDRRRPQDVVLLSPLLRHWGLELQFDPEQADGERQTVVSGVQVPIHMSGRFLVRESAGQDALCRMEADGLVAQCAIGKGRAVIVADAALLEESGNVPESGRDSALEVLVSQAFHAD